MEPLDLSMPSQSPEDSQPEYHHFQKIDSDFNNYKEFSPMFSRQQLPSGIVTPPSRSPDAMVPSFDNTSFTEMSFKDFKSPVVLGKIPSLPLVPPLSEEELQRKAEELFQNKSPKNRSINLNMRRGPYPMNANGDPLYVEKRKKNNEAAKRSRDLRKLREQVLGIKYGLLQDEYRQQHGICCALWYQCQRQQKEIEELRCRAKMS